MRDHDDLNRGGPAPEEVESGERTTGVVIRAMLDSEVNTLKYPLFALSRHEAKNKIETVYKESDLASGGPRERYWQVTANAKYGFPGPFDRRVFRAVEGVISEMPKPIKNPISFTLYNLCQRIGISERSGRNIKNIKESLRRIKYTGVRAKGTFFNKEQRQCFADKSFSLYDTIVFFGEEMPDGSIAERNFLFLNQIYLQSINSFYTKPLDYAYLKRLASPIAERCYELLGVKFFGMSDDQALLRYRYSNFCDLLPVRRQRFYSAARRILEPAFEELTTTKFLSKLPEWSPTEQKSDWYIHFWPGERALAECRGFLKEQGETSFLPAPEIQAPIVDSVTTAAKWVSYFYRRLHQNERELIQPTKRETELAKSCIDKYGEETLKEIIDDTIRHARSTGWALKSFGGIKNQILETVTKRQTAQESQIRRDAQKNERELFAEYTDYLKNKIIELTSGPQKEDYERIVLEEENQIYSRLRHLPREKVRRNPEFDGMLESFVRQRLLAEGYVVEYKKWVEEKHHGN